MHKAQKICKNLYNFEELCLFWTKRHFLILVSNRIKNEINSVFLCKDEIQKRYNMPSWQNVQKFFDTIMEIWRHNKFFYFELNFISVINNLWKFHVNVISLSEVISISILSILH